MNFKKLNLGCGQFPKEGYVNLDIDKNSLADIICDLNKFPYPLKDNSFELIVADHVLEHLNYTFKVMQELSCILTTNGKLIIRVPHFSRGFTHPDHKIGFDVSFPFYFSKEFKGGYTGVEFRLETVRLRWFAQEYLKRTILSRPIFVTFKILGKILDRLANASPFFCSRCWCFLVGGFEEIEFVFVKK